MLGDEADVEAMNALGDSWPADEAWDHALIGEVAAAELVAEGYEGMRAIVEHNARFVDAQMMSVGFMTTARQWAAAIAEGLVPGSQQEHRRTAEAFIFPPVLRGVVLMIYEHASPIYPALFAGARMHLTDPGRN